MNNRERTKALGDWGEKAAIELLRISAFRNIKDLNLEHPNHPFGDIYAERKGMRFLISVRTRNKYTARGSLNSAYNVCKKGTDLTILATRYRAQLAWVAVQVDAVCQLYSAYFGTLDDLNRAGERYSIPMSEKRTQSYECLTRDVFDSTIKPEWTNQIRTNNQH